MLTKACASFSLPYLSTFLLSSVSWSLLCSLSVHLCLRVVPDDSVLDPFLAVVLDARRAQHQ